MIERIVIVGANGAGKTWLARKLAIRHGLPVISKDALALTTGWKLRPSAEVSADIIAATAAPRWILEGGPSILKPEVLQRAQLVIWLDLPAIVRFGRVVFRSLRYFGRTRPEHPPGNPDWPGRRQFAFAGRSLLSGRRFRTSVQQGLLRCPCKCVRLGHKRDVQTFCLERTS